MQIKLFTMVKNEIDIIDDWIFYHGSLFGYENIYIIDNYSDDGTYEKIIRFKAIGINVFRETDYKKKGEYMTKLCNTYCDSEDIAYPIDIDEFVIFYDKYTKQISVDKNTIISYIKNLPDAEIYKTNYIYAGPNQDFPDGFDRSARECTKGFYDKSYNDNAKSFFKKKLYLGVIDHGNHLPKKKNFLTHLCLIHFHVRNLEQIQKKIHCNVSGFGYKVDNLNFLKELIKKDRNCDGGHHVQQQICILENTYKLPCYSYTGESIDLTPINEFIKQFEIN